MVAVPEGDDELAHLERETWAIGNAVVAVGEHHDATDALAVWQLSPLGTATGAWILPQAEAFGSRDAARRLLTVLERRAITAAEPEHIDPVLEQLSATAELEDQWWWANQTFHPPQALAELIERRQAYEDTVETARARRTNVAELNWRRDFTSADFADFGSVRRTAGVHVPSESPVASSALTVCRVLHWLAGAWSETEQVKNRRSYVRDAHGPPEPLPPSWLTTVHTASTTRIAL